MLLARGLLRENEHATEVIHAWRNLKQLPNHKNTSNNYARIGHAIGQFGKDARREMGKIRLATVPRSLFLGHVLFFEGFHVNYSHVRY